MKSEYLFHFILLCLFIDIHLAAIHFKGDLLMKSRLVINNPHTKDLTSLFDEYDRPNLTHMRGDEVKCFMDRLDHHRHALLSRIQEFRRREAAHLPRMMERGPAGIMGPYPGPMYPPPPYNFPHSPGMVGPQPTPIQSFGKLQHESSY
jgi:hypothetical protein